MDIAWSLLTATTFLAAGAGFVYCERSLLLTDAYKFPYPLTSTFFGIVTTTFLSLIISLILKAFSVRILVRCWPNSLLEEAAVEASEPLLSTHDRSESAKPTFKQDGLSDKQLPWEELAVQNVDDQKTRLRKCWLNPLAPDSSGSLFSCRVCFALVLAWRLVIGVELLSRVSFFTYTSFAVMALPLTLALNYKGEAASWVLLSVAETFLLILVVFPKAHIPDVGTGIIGAMLPLADMLLAMSATRAFRRPWHHNTQAWSLNAILKQKGSHFQKLRFCLDAAGQTWGILAQTSSIALMVMLPCLKLSGEIADIGFNSYVLGNHHFLGRITAVSTLQFAWLLVFSVIATNATSVSISGLQTTLHSILVAVVYHNSLTTRHWINLSLCWVLFLARLLQKPYDNQGFAIGGRNTWRVVRKIFLGTVLYGALYQGSITIEEYLESGAIALPFIDENLPSHHSNVTLPMTETWEHAGEIRDGYLGKRLNAETTLNWEEILSTCKDSRDGYGVEDIARCLSYLSTAQSEYLNTTQSEIKQQPVNLPAIKAKIKETTANLMHKDSHKASKVKMDACNGELFTYHSYWAGRATWRVELFIKAFLYTQNLACSRLWIWLDTDIEPEALDKMLYHDALFQRFWGLLEEGYISLKTWKIPQRVPLPRLNHTISTQIAVSRQQTNGMAAAEVTDGIVEDASGDSWFIPDPLYKVYSTPTQISDFVRFVVLHLHGGVYLDMDVLLLRDLRPLLLPDPSSSQPNTQPAWAEQWVEHAENPGDYNTAVLSLPSNSSLSSYLLLGGKRMGMNYHPRVLGLMLWKDRRNGELAMLHNAIFDPLVTNLRRKKTSICTVPCHKNFEAAFMEDIEEPQNEWSNFNPTANEVDDDVRSKAAPNRTMENFFNGAFAYHIHNQWNKFPEPHSWMDVITQAQDGFFAGTRTNPYGELWGGPSLEGFDRDDWKR